MTAQRVRRWRTTVRAAALVAEVAVIAACSPSTPSSTSQRVIPRGGTKIIGPVKGVGTHSFAARHFAAGTPLGFAISCEGSGEATVYLQTTSTKYGGLGAGCSPHNGGGGMASGLLRMPVDADTHLVVTARAGTRWRVVLYRGPAALPPDASPSPTTKPSATSATPSATSATPSATSSAASATSTG